MRRIVLLTLILACILTIPSYGQEFDQRIEPMVGPQRILYLM